LSEIINTIRLKDDNIADLEEFLSSKMAECDEFKLVVQTLQAEQTK